MQVRVYACAIDAEDFWAILMTTPAAKNLARHEDSRGRGICELLRACAARLAARVIRAVRLRNARGELSSARLAQSPLFFGSASFLRLGVGRL
jgi:hypothetical protein